MAFFHLKLFSRHMFTCSICSYVQMFTCSNVQMFKCSNVHVHMFRCSHVQMFRCSHVDLSRPILEKGYCSNKYKSSSIWTFSRATRGVPFEHLKITMHSIVPYKSAWLMQLEFFYTGIRWLNAPENPDCYSGSLDMDNRMGKLWSFQRFLWVWQTKKGIKFQLNPFFSIG